MSVATAQDWHLIRQLAAETVWSNLFLPQDPPAITGDQKTDQHWRQIAERRGYRRRPLVADTSHLKTVGTSSHRLQPQAADAIHALQNAANLAGHQPLVSSAYRDHNHQAKVFLNPIIDKPLSEQVIDERLRWSAIPGYSWHHTGYVIDLREGVFALKQFIHSESYQWLIADNYLQARTHGWIPNYPPGIQNQGPDPEPWEFIWVGDVDLLWPQIQKQW